MRGRGGRCRASSGLAQAARIADGMNVKSPVPLWSTIQVRWALLTEALNEWIDGQAQELLAPLGAV